MVRGAGFEPAETCASFEFSCFVFSHSYDVARALARETILRRHVKVWRVHE